MNKKLENFINSNRRAFDQVEQPDALQFWVEFQAKRQASKRLNLWSAIGIAASILLAIGIFTLFDENEKEEPSWVIQNLHQIDPQLADYQAILITAMAVQDSTFESIGIDPATNESFSKQLKELDEITEKYREDLEKYGPNPKVIKSLLRCAKLRIRLYEILLFEIQLDTHYENLEYEEYI